MRSIPLLAHGKCPVLPGAVCFRLPRTDGTLFSSGHLTAMRCSKCRGQLEQSQDTRFIDRFMLMIVDDGLWYSSIPLEQLQVTVEPWSSLGTWCSSCWHVITLFMTSIRGSLVVLTESWKLLGLPSILDVHSLFPVHRKLLAMRQPAKEPDSDDDWEHRMVTNNFNTFNTC